MVFGLAGAHISSLASNQASMPARLAGDWGRHWQERARPTSCGRTGGQPVGVFSATFDEYPLMINQPAPLVGPGLVAGEFCELFI